MAQHKIGGDSMAEPKVGVIIHKCPVCDKFFYYYEDRFGIRLFVHKIETFMGNKISWSEHSGCQIDIPKEDKT